MFGEGFLGGGATFGADLNLLVQIGLGLLLLIGMVLARRGLYRAHGACQSAALALAIVMTLVWMWPSFREIYVPDLARGIANRNQCRGGGPCSVGQCRLAARRVRRPGRGDSRDPAAVPLPELQCVDADAARPLVDHDRAWGAHLLVRERLTRRMSSQ